MMPLNERMIWNDGDIVVEVEGDDEPEVESDPKSPKITEAFDPNQPRGDDGRWINKGDIALAKGDQAKADELFARTTDPAERKKLEKATGMKPSKGKTSSRKPKPDRSRSERAKAAHVPATKAMQDHGHSLERSIATKIGAKISGEDSEAVDNVLPSGHAIEAKVIMRASDQRVNMRRDSRMRKESWARKNKKKVFMVVRDDRDTWEGGKHKSKWSGHHLYVFDKPGAWALKSGIKVKSLAEARRTIERLSK